MKYLKFLPVLILSVIALSACNDDNDEPKGNTADLPLQSAYNSILSTSNGVTTALPGADFNLHFDLDRGLVDISALALQYAPDKSAVSFDLTALPLRVGNTGWHIESDAPRSVSTSSGNITVSDIELDFTTRLTGDQNLVKFEFTIDSRYDICVMFNNSQFTAETTSTDVNNPTVDPFTTTESAYLVILNRQKNTAEVQIRNPRFLQAMPAGLGIMRFTDIPVTYMSDGFSFNTAGLTPYIGQEPYPAFALTDISGVVVAGETLDLQFTCPRFERKVVVDGKAY